MTPEQALHLLDQLVSQGSANRQVHFQAIEAINVLKKVLDSSK